MNGIIAQLLTERLKIHLVLDFTRMATTNNNLSPVIHDLLDLLSTNPQTSADSLAIPVAAIHSLLRVINRRLCEEDALDSRNLLFHFLEESL